MSKNHSEKFVALVDDALTRIPEISTNEVAERLQDGEKLMLIDTREAFEFEEGHLPGAIHLSKGVIERDIEDEIPDQDRELILYCGGGYRSALAGDNLLKMGYTNVKSMAGGWREWTEKNLPTDES
ncbi:MAG: sulfurtransferase [Bacteroidetes bacterium]|jgi:rhodanese-related sulfurtransferase|nr:sulfurtransferase [Bacteroidota bacterium]